MSVERWPVLVVLVGMLSQLFLWAAQYEMNILYERCFDAEIEQVVFDYYEKENSREFYPKIVVLKHLDPSLSQGEYKFYEKEVQIIDSTCNLNKSLRFPYFTMIGCSEKGNYFYVWTSVPEKPIPYHPSQLELPETKTTRTSFAVYDDEGTVLWETSPFEIPYDVSPTFHISPKDGGVVACMMNDKGATTEVFYAPDGSVSQIRPHAMYDNYELGFCDFGKDWNYIVALTMKYPLVRYEELPGKSPESALLLFDSQLNLIWKRHLDEYLGNSAGISANGSYIYAAGHTMAGVQKGLASATGYLYDTQGNLILEIKNGSTFRAFSSDEKYLLIDFNPPRKEKQTRGIGLIDIETRDVLFTKEFRIIHGIIAPNGTVAILRETKPAFESNQLEDLPVEKAREYVQHIGEQASLGISIFDSEGKLLFESAEFKHRAGETWVRILSWDGEQLIVCYRDKATRKIRIVQFRS